MRTAVNYLKRFKKDFPELSWADIIQLASAVSIELAGGPKTRPFVNTPYIFEDTPKTFSIGALLKNPKI